jgi:hypothetical protein
MCFVSRSLLVAGKGRGFRRDFVANGGGGRKCPKFGFLSDVWCVVGKLGLLFYGGILDIWLVLVILDS